MRSPNTLASVVINAISNSKSNSFVGPNPGVLLPSVGRICPTGLLTGVPEGTIEELLP